MRTLSILALAAGLPIVAMSAAAAQPTPQPPGAMPGTNMNANCRAGDPEVTVDKSSKTYTLGPNGKAPRAARPMRANETGVQSNAASADSRNSAAQSSLVTMCKSQADGMGAHMSANSTNPNNH